jgi:sugar/nucleoside kinase (ribokinase family)
MLRLNIDERKLRYRALIGTGGIGSGSFFTLNGNHTLGREESRSGRFIDRNDYCKLHIVSHYVKTLLGPVFDTLPVGMVGDDDTGRRLFSEMEQAGLDMKYVELSGEYPTLFSFCFIYPDGSGGNMTTDNSACSAVTPEYVEKAEKTFIRYRGMGIALAVPEVGLEARKKVIELGKKYSLFCVASFSSEEMKNAGVLDLFSNVDLLASNIDEAATASGFKDRLIDHEDYQAAVSGLTGGLNATVEASIKSVLKINPSMYISITAGRRGSWVWDGKDISYLPAPEVEVVSTAGAGDAFLAGLICGISANLEISKAHELGALTGGLSVTSPHTINKNVDRASLSELARTGGIDISDEVKKLLEEE